MKKALFFIACVCLVSLAVAPALRALEEASVSSAIAAVIKGHVVARHKDLRPSDVNVLFRSADGTMRAIAQKKGKLTFAIADVYSNYDPLGDAYIPIQIFADGRASDVVYLRARIEAWKDIVVSAGKLVKKSRISDGDVAIKRTDVGSIPNRYFTDTGLVVGKEMLTTLSPGAVLQDWMVRVPPMVKKSEDVTIVAEMSTMVVTAKGLALEDGYKGEMIRVKNADTKRELKATVIDQGRVSVEL